MKYTQPGIVDYGDYDPEGRAVSGFETTKLDTTDTFGTAVLTLILKSTGRTYGTTRLLMTTRSHWSGYSEFTITNTWSEIAITAPDWNLELEWPSLGDFLRAVAKANPEKEDS